MKVLSIAIPVYNTELYIQRNLDSILLDEIIDDIEIIVVNDGSKDNSIDVIKKYQQKYPNDLIVIDKENGGHGSTINAALKIAKGKYFRVLDSDDWVNSSDFIKFVKKLKDEEADVVITDYKKEYVFSGESEYLRWKKLEEDKLYDFNEFDLDLLNKEYFVMANSTYKTEILKQSGLKLFEKIFYVDMQYNFVPIICVNTFKYYKLDIYRYFIGRPDQSMNLDNFVRNRGNHEKVMKYLVEYYTDNQDKLSKNKKEYLKLILFYMLTTHYYIYCVYSRKGKRSLYKEIKSFDKYLKKENIEIYKMMNDISHIRYNRMTKFVFVRLCPHLFNKAINAGGRLFRKEKD